MDVEVHLLPARTMRWHDVQSCICRQSLLPWRQKIHQARALRRPTPSRIMIVAACLLRQTSAKPRVPSGLEELTRSAAKAYEAGEAAASVARYREALVLAPVSVQLRRSLGNVLYRSARFAEAASALQTALALEPQHRATRKVLSDALAASGDLASALWHFGQIPISPGIALPPLSSALAAPWQQPPRGAVSAVQPGSADVPSAYFTELEPSHRGALRELADFLSAEVLGESYGFEFRSSSLPVAGPGAIGGKDLLEQAVRRLRSLLPPAARRAAQCAEWWVHRRPPRRPMPGVRALALEGHPLHWDNDGAEARGQPPLFTSVLYLASATVAPAPTVVLNTSRSGSGFRVGDVAWLIHAAEGRVASIPGGMLHGVLPSAGAIDVPGDAARPARLSLNVAWWPHACRRSPQEGLQSAAPPADVAWAVAMETMAGAESMVPEPVTSIFCGEDMCGRARPEL